MFRVILSIAISAALLGLATAKIVLMGAPTNSMEWLMFGIFAAIGIVALLRLITLAKLLDAKLTKTLDTKADREEENKQTKTGSAAE